MRVIKPFTEILSPIDGDDILKRIERAGRICYKSEDRITPESAQKFVASIIKRGHESVLEHISISVRFVCDRGIMAELTRHRISSFSVESTRFCNYANSELQFIMPFYFAESHDGEKNDAWYETMKVCESAYLTLLSLGAKPEEARSVLPNSLKTEVVMTANLREWRTVFRQRCSKHAHPAMRELTIPLLNDLKQRIPVIFDDIEVSE